MSHTVDTFRAPAEVIKHLLSTGFIKQEDLTPEIIDKLTRERIEALVPLFDLDFWIDIIPKLSCNRCAILSHPVFEFKGRHMPTIIFAIREKYYDTLAYAIRKSTISPTDMDEIVKAYIATPDYDIYKVLSSEKNLPWTRVQWDLAATRKGYKMAVPESVIADDARQIAKVQLLANMEPELAALKVENAELKKKIMPTPEIIPTVNERLQLMVYMTRKMIVYMMNIGYITPSEITEDVIEHIPNGACDIVFKYVSQETLEKYFDGPRLFENVFQYVLEKRIITLAKPFEVLRKYKYGSPGNLSHYLAQYPMNSDEYLECARYHAKNARASALKEIIDHPNVSVIRDDIVETFVKTNGSLVAAYFKRTGVNLDPKAELAETKLLLTACQQELAQLKETIRNI